MDVASRLGRALPELCRSDSAADKITYARDLWPRRLLEVRAGRVAEHRPAAIAWPSSTEEVAKLVRWAASEGVPLVPFGAGSGVCGGVTPDPDAVVVDLKRLSRVRALDESAPSLEVESGALGITLAEELERRGFTIGHFPSSILCSTVGGWVAARSAGQCSGRYGKVEDMVVALECVLGDGEVVTLRRRARGLDLTPLVIGSEGTLAVVTSATLRLHEAPASRAFGAFSFPTIEAGWTAMREMFQTGLRPSVARLYDPFDSFIAKMGSVRRSSEHGEPKKKRPGGGSSALAMVLRAPGALNALVNALGDRLLGGSTLVLIFEGGHEESASDLGRASLIAKRLGARSLGEEPARRWMRHRYSVSYRQAPIFMNGAFSDTMEVAAPWSCLRGLYDGVRKALGKHVFVMAHLSHAYPDGCSIYFTFAGSAASDAEAEARYDEAWQQALTAAIEAGGTLSHHHGVGRSKAPRMGAELGLGVEVVRALTQAADPARILNRGNLLPEGRIEPRAIDAACTFAIDGDSLLARAPASETLADFERTLSKRGLTLGLARDAALDVPLGDWLAAGCAGGRDPWEDPVDHVVAGMTAELPSGARIEARPCPRRAVGPDLTALFVGAEGRFGRVLDATLRVHRAAAPRARTLPFTAPSESAPSDGEERLAQRFAEAVGKVE